MASHVSRTTALTVCQTAVTLYRMVVTLCRMVVDSLAVGTIKKAMVATEVGPVDMEVELKAAVAVATLTLTLPTEVPPVWVAAVETSAVGAAVETAPCFPWMASTKRTGTSL